MRHNPFDRLAKAIASAVVERLSTVESEREVAPPAQYIDLAYDIDVGATPESWTGWLGRMIAQGPGMLEHFSRAPQVERVDECLRKHLNYDHVRVLRAREQQQQRPVRSRLWLICAGRPSKALREHRAEPMAGWPEGFWRSGRWPWMCFVVLRDLPQERATLLLRLMGRGRTLRQALVELQALPWGAEERELMKSLLVALPRQSFQDSDTKELSMQARESYAELMAIYKEWEQEVTTRARRQGRKEGLLQGERTLLIRQITRRFGRLPAKVVARIEAAGKGELETWGERVLDARSLAEIFD